MNIKDKALGWLDNIIPNMAGGLSGWIAALIIIIIGFFVAKIIAGIFRALLKRTSIDEKIASATGQRSAGTEKAIASFVFWVVMLFVVVLALEAAGQEQILEPINGMLTKIFEFLPNLIGAAVVGFIAWILATVAKNVVGGLLGATRVDDRLGLGSTKPITTTVSMVVFFGIILMLLPVVLSFLKMDAISGPIGDMINQIFNYAPKLLSAIALFAIGYLIASIVQKVLSSVLTSVGTDSLPAKLGFRGDMGGRSLSTIISYIAMASILVVIAAQAIQVLDLDFITDLAQNLVPGYMKILVAVIIFAAAFFIANLVGQLIEPKSRFWAKFARIAIIVFLGAVALQKANISPLTNDTFQLIINCLIIAATFAAGVGGAIAFGLGGKDKARGWLDRLR